MLRFKHSDFANKVANLVHLIINALLLKCNLEMVFK